MKQIMTTEASYTPQQLGELSNFTLSFNTTEASYTPQQLGELSNFTLSFNWIT